MFPYLPSSDRANDTDWPAVISIHFLSAIDFTKAGSDLSPGFSPNPNLPYSARPSVHTLPGKRKSKP